MSRPELAVARAAATMTVLFADICGSTRLYSSLGDEAARAIVAAGLDVVTAVLPAYQGRLVKSIGDEVMCVFPDPDRAIAAAADMQRKVQAARPLGGPFAIHIGLQHGTVLLEGSDVFGDVVNAASYLCAVASAGQILTTAATVAALSIAARATTRPLFHAVIKGASTESVVHQVVWEDDTSVLTDVNLRRHNLLPPDAGSLVVCAGSREIRIDPRRPVLVLGRGDDCDLRVSDPFASRRHATLVLRRTQFYLNDHSTNGTFVRREDGEVAHVFRSELMLDGNGDISLGRSFEQSDLEIVGFRRDRRSLYRV